MKHTKGPWSVPHLACDDCECNCAWVLSGQYCGAVAEVYFDNGKRISDGGNDCPPLEEAKANARLIAAAPDLLEALQLLLAKVRRDAPELSGKLMGFCDATIAKATEATHGPTK